MTKYRGWGSQGDWRRTRGRGLESVLNFKTHRVLLGDKGVWGVGPGSGI